MSFNVFTHLGKEFPDSIYFEAYKQAERSTLKNFKTGAVVFKGEDVYLRGCSHTKINNGPHASIHAEQHCIEEAMKSNLRERNAHNYIPSGLSMFILCIGKTGNPAFSSKPCYSCSQQLDRIPVEYVYYLERMNSGQWIMNVKTQVELIAEAEKSGVRLDHYAKNMRIK